MNKLDFLLSKVNGSKELDFGTIFNKSMELFKKTWVEGLVVFLITMVAIIPLYILMYVPLLAMGLFYPDSLESGNKYDFILLLPLGLVILVFVFLAMVISFGLKSAFFRICKMKDFNEAISNDYLYFFKKPYLGKTIKLTLLTFGISLLAMLLCFFPLIYVMIPLALINVIYAFNPDMTASEVIKVGFALGNKKWLITMGLIIVTGLLAQVVGMVLCFIGVFVTASFVYIPLYFVYKESIGFDKADEVADIGITHE